MANKRLFITTIGTGKTVAHGIFKSIESYNPDIVLPIVTEASKTKSLPELVNFVTEWNDEVEFEDAKIIENVDEFPFLHTTFSSIIREYLQKGYRRNNIFVDYTSGTKAMSAALVSAAIANEIDKICYVPGKRDEEGRVISGTEKPQSLSPNLIYSAQKLNTFISLFNRYQFVSAINFLSETDIHPDFNEDKTFLLNLTEFFNLWDKFDFKGAFNQLAALSDNELLKKFKLKKKMDTFRGLISKLKEDHLDYYKVNDLVFNAARRGSEGKYDDASARLYRALEMIGQTEFQNQFGCTTSDIELDKLPGKFKEIVKNKYHNNSKKKYQIPLWITFDILAETGNEKGNIFVKNKKHIEANIHKRNDSILAHGTQPVTKESFHKFFEFLTNKFQIGENYTGYENFEFPKINYKF